MAAAVAGAAASASSSTQKTYSQARSRLGRDSSLPMLRSAAARISRQRTSEPGSLLDGQHERRPMPVVQGRSSRGRGADAGRRASGRARTRKRVRFSGTVWISAARTVRPKPRRRAWREDGRGAAFLAIRDELAGTGRVVGRQQAPGPRTKEGLGLTERLDVGVDALDRLEALARQRGEAQVDRHDDLADDDEVVLEEQVVGLPDRPLDDVLDGHHAALDGCLGGGVVGPPTRHDRLEDLTESGHGHRLGRRRRRPARHPRRRRLAPRNTRSGSWHPESSGAGRRDGSVPCRVEPRPTCAERPRSPRSASGRRSGVCCTLLVATATSRPRPRRATRTDHVRSEFRACPVSSRTRWPWPSETSSARLWARSSTRCRDLARCGARAPGTGGSAGGRREIVMRIDEVEGIGAAYAAKLGEVGINTTDDLIMAAASAAGREKVAGMTGISAGQLLKWVNHVDLMRIEGVGPGVCRPARGGRRRLTGRARPAQRGQPGADLPGDRRRSPELDPARAVRGHGRRLDRQRRGDGEGRQPLTIGPGRGRAREAASPRPSALEPGGRVVSRGVLVELRRGCRVAGLGGRPGAVPGRVRGAGPMRLGEQVVDRLDVGLDRGRDDVRRGRRALVGAFGAGALSAGRRGESDRSPDLQRRVPRPGHGRRSR